MFRNSSSSTVRGFVEFLDTSTGILEYDGETDVLENYILDQSRDVFVVDDHNHALAGWTAALYEGLFDSRPILVHVDYHEDSANPPEDFKTNLPTDFPTLEEQVHLLEIDEFIEAGKMWDIYDEVINVGVQSHYSDLDQDLYRMKEAIQDSDDVILDIDMDVYNRDDLVDDFDLRLADAVSESEFTSFATSPGYVQDQEEIIEKINSIVAMADRL
ncbi:MAG: hypothetical protein J07AB43_07390 [Candidatus Nanosalina sp. J07AB43]|nr:MAG: hypothetical protein J07AB43_07390 [Candidatus Nanosalina sp. J07AB43]